MTPDFSLVAQVAISGNRRAFDELVRRYQSPVRRFFLNQTLGDSQLSDDLSQDTFIKAYTSIASFRGLASFQTWLMRIAYNVFYDYRRKMSNERMETSDVSEAIRDGRAATHSSLLTTHSSLSIDLYAALSLLKPEERSCITLQLIDGHQVDKIAEITGIPANTVKSHLKRGKDKLAIYLKQNGYDR